MQISPCQDASSAPSKHSHKLVGVDPGMTGALAVFDLQRLQITSVHDMPVADGELDISELARILREISPTVAIVERVASRNTDSRPAAFKFGGAYMGVRAVLTMLQIPQHLFTPQEWKAKMRLKGGDEGKEQARAMALRLFPSASSFFSAKKHHNRAEAALLARFGAAQGEILLGSPIPIDSDLA